MDNPEEHSPSLDSRAGQRGGHLKDLSAPTVGFSAAQQLEFVRKELRETLRDHRTIVTLMVMPLVLYPLLGFGLRFLALNLVGEEKVEFRLAIETDAEAAWLSKALMTSAPGPGADAGSDESPDIQLLMPNEPSQFDLESMVAESAVDLGIRIDAASISGGGPTRVKIYQNDEAQRSRDAAYFMEKRLAAFNMAAITAQAQQRGEKLAIPVEHTTELLRPSQGGSAVIGLLPLILLLMTVTGGVYPAIDLTAGERERNTMESLMALPVPRFRVLAAKYVAVVTVTMLTGLMNLLAMSITLYALQLDTSLLGDSGFTLGLVVKLFLALAVFALFYSAVLLLLTSSARSFKEAQAYLIPLLLLSITPGLVVFMPTWRLDTATAALPLVNILLLSRELLEGTVQRLPAFVAVVSTILYGVFALSLAAKVFGKDAVAVGGRGRWRDLFHRPANAPAMPSISSALLTLALLFPAYTIASGILARGDVQPATRLVYSALLTIVLFVGIPGMLLRWQRVSLTESLGLRLVAWPQWMAAVLLGLVTWPWVFELVLFAHNLGLRGFDPSQIENVDALLASWKEIPTWMIVLCLGLVPGICEEWFFRGYLFNGLRQHLNVYGTVVTTAVSFGLFHVVLAGGAAPERILPSTLMGLLLGWVAWQTRSIVPSMILHTLHNSTLLMVVQSRSLLAAWSIGQTEQEHLPRWWLAVSGAVLLCGIAVVYSQRRGTVQSAQPT